MTIQAKRVDGDPYAIEAPNPWGPERVYRETFSNWALLVQNAYLAVGRLRLSGIVLYGNPAPGKAHLNPCVGKDTVVLQVEATAGCHAG